MDISVQDLRNADIPESFLSQYLANLDGFFSGENPTPLTLLIENITLSDSQKRMLAEFTK